MDRDRKHCEMIMEHVISDNLFNEVNTAFSKKEYWVAYNTVPYLLDKGDIYFFETASEAYSFSRDNISDYDCFKVVHAYSFADLLKHFCPEKQAKDPDANGLYNKDGNAFTDALIEHFEQQQFLNSKRLSTLNEKEVKQTSGHGQTEKKVEQKQGKQIGKKGNDETENSLLPKMRNRKMKGRGIK